MEINFIDGVYHFTGRLDEFAELDTLTQASSEPLKINLGKVVSINSVGVRKFLAFAMSWSPKKFELQECTPEFIANANVIPQLLGHPSDVRQIKSFYVPFSCEPCKQLDNVLIDCEAMRFYANGDIALPAKTCIKCGSPMELDVEKSEYFMFLAGLHPKAG